MVSAQLNFLMFGDFYDLFDNIAVMTSRLPTENKDRTDKRTKSIKNIDIMTNFFLSVILSFFRNWD